MYDSVEIFQEEVNASARWLILIHQIPPKPDYFRVKVRRRLQAIGALPLKNSVYVLPSNSDTLEDFQWLQRMVVEEGGEATVCSASFLGGITDQEVESMFRAQSNEEFQAIVEDAREVRSSPTEADLRRLKKRLDRARARDFFDSDGSHVAREAVAELERKGHAEGEGDGSSHLTEVSRPRGATWVTRQGVFVDRISSAWLIRRFIDPTARFKLVPARDYDPQPGELRFDMFEGEYTHEGEDCTFEVLLSRFGIADPALRAIADVVHDIDCKDDKFGREETAGIEGVIRGITLAHTDDRERLEAGAATLDGLYSLFQQRSG